MYGTNKKPLEALTKDQKSLYDALGGYIRTNKLQQLLATALLERDSSQKGFLQRYLIEDAFNSTKFTIKSQQFDILLGVLDKTTNRQNQQEFNYKQMLEYLIGSDEATKYFTQGLKGRKTQLEYGGEEDKDDVVYKFTLPAQPVNPLNMILGEIGFKVIQSSINIEEEFKKRVGNYT